MTNRPMNTSDDPTLTERKALTRLVDGAIRHRLKWASVHWQTEKVAGEAWSHIADAVVVALMARPAPATTHIDTAARAQALRDAAHAAVSEDDGIPWDHEYDRALVATWLDERADSLAQAPDPTPNPATVTMPVEVYVREPGPEVTEVEQLYSGARSHRTPTGWGGSTWYRVVSLGPWVPVGTRATLRKAGEGR